MNPIEARNAMLERFVEAWKPTGFQYRVENMKALAGQPAIPTGDSPWAKVTIRHEDGATTSLTGAHGVRRYEAVGYIIVQLFAPSGDANTKLYELADMLVSAFTKLTPHDCITYSRQRFQEKPGATGMAQVNFFTDFSYESER